MRLFTKTFVCLAAVAAIAAASASAATTVSVSAMSGSGGVYASSGVTLAANQQAVVSASGTWCAGVGPNGCFGPGGVGVPAGAGAPAPALAAGSLIATLDGGATWVEVGSGPVTLTGPGTIQFAFDDSYYADNSGSISASINVFPTTSTQCKGSSWQQYGFKNQGACLNYVAGH